MGDRLGEHGRQWVVPDWPAPANVRAFVTTRAGGVSGGEYASLNLGAHSGDSMQNVERNRAIVREHLPAMPRWLTQVHGTAVAARGRAGARRGGDRRRRGRAHGRARLRGAHRRLPAGAARRRGGHARGGGPRGLARHGGRRDRECGGRPGRRAGRGDRMARPRDRPPGVRGRATTSTRRSPRTIPAPRRPSARGAAASSWPTSTRWRDAASRAPGWYGSTAGASAPGATRRASSPTGARRRAAAWAPSSGSHDGARLGRRRLPRGARCFRLPSPRSWPRACRSAGFPRW